MKNAIKIRIIETEKILGQKVDDYMICLTREDADEFRSEFNSANGHEIVPDWYIYASSDYDIIELDEIKFSFLKENKRAWLSRLNKVTELKSLNY